MTPDELRAKCEAIAAAGDAQAAATLRLFRQRDDYKAYWDQNFKDMVRAQETAQKYLGQIYRWQLLVAMLIASHPCTERAS